MVNHFFFLVKNYSRLITFFMDFLYANSIVTQVFKMQTRYVCLERVKARENFFFAYFLWLALTKFKICRYSKNFWVCPFSFALLLIRKWKIRPAKELCWVWIWKVFSFTFLWGGRNACSSHSKIIFDFLCFISYAKRSQFYCFKDRRKCFSIDRGSQFFFP